MVRSEEENLKEIKKKEIDRPVLMFLGSQEIFLSCTLKGYFSFPVLL